jgi:quinol-cytochrome oxidoreductase complex cytochrome b subunit
MVQRAVDWVDERAGVRRLWVALFERRIPRGVGWSQTLGSVLVFLFIVQVVTGMALAMNYSPSPDQARDSIEFIEDQVALGSLIRGVHRWSASAMVIVVFLHMVRVYVHGAYKYPRELTWVIGVFLLLIVLGFGFTGYLLPWDQKAYWATEVGTNLVGSTPYIGEFLLKVTRGGEELGAVTLTRFFALHVLVLPALAITFIAAHLYLVVKQGIAAPPEE